MPEVDPARNVTARQLELIALVASGHLLDEIATEKFLACSTVQQTLATARKRVGAKTIAHLCVLCLNSGLIYKDGTRFKPVQEERVVGE